MNFNHLLNEFRNSKDPTILTVMVEDSAALLGIGIAALGIFLTDITGNTVYDAISSIIIGGLLMSFAFFLAKENRGLLLGESITPKQYKEIIRVVRNLKEVDRVVNMKTMHLGPKDILVGIEVHLVDKLNTDQIELITNKIEDEIIKVIPESR